MKIKRIFAACVAAGLMISGCSKIPEYSSGESAASDTSGGSSSAAVNEKIPDSFSANPVSVVKQNFLSKLNAEGGVYEKCAIRTDGAFDGKGYLRMSTGGKLTHIVKANTPQLYRVIIAARSETGASVKLSVKKKTEGVFYVPALSETDYVTTTSDDGAEIRSAKFSLFEVDTVYLTNGSNVIDLIAEKGSVDIDYILVENSDGVKSSCYKTGTSAVNPSAGVPTVGVMKYLSEVYGENILTAVNTSVATNAEIDAVYKATGRYPAIRCGQLALAVMDDEDSTEKVKADAELSLEWGRQGGIISYKWHWYSPNVKRSVNAGTFDLEDALDVPNLDDIAQSDTDELRMLMENGYLSPNTLALINDIDKAALVLGLFNKEGLPVLFEPIPNADTGLYWWGESAELHKKLYTLIFNRMCRYHKLGNLIWVWSGSSAEFYPGANYCDIIGQSIFEESNASFAGRLSALSESFSAKKPICVTARDVVPSIDFIVRDNAMWLWSSIEAGKYIVNDKGSLTSAVNSISALNTAYNSDVFITRDELPSLSDYAVN